jgi:hypothetical protein
MIPSIVFESNLICRVRRVGCKSLKLSIFAAVFSLEIKEQKGESLYGEKGGEKGLT